MPNDCKYGLPTVFGLAAPRLGMKPSKGAGVVYNDNEVGLPTVFALAAPYLSSTRHGQHFYKM